MKDIKKEELKLERLPELKERFNELEKQIDKKYTERIKAHIEYDYQWYKKEIYSLKEEQDYIERLINRIKRFNVQVGDGVTIHLYSDSYAATVIKRTPKSITVQQDKAIRIDKNGMSEDQEYRFERDEKGWVSTYRWSDVYGAFRSSGDQSIGITNGRYEYFDYSF